MKDRCDCLRLLFTVRRRQGRCSAEDCPWNRAKIEVDSTCETGYLRTWVLSVLRVVSDQGELDTALGLPRGHDRETLLAEELRGQAGEALAADKTNDAARCCLLSTPA